MDIETQTTVTVKFTGEEFADALRILTEGRQFLYGRDAEFADKFLHAAHGFFNTVAS